MIGKRALMASLCSKSGVTKLLELLPHNRRLLILNYHRIGNPADTPYDPGTFGPSAEEFDWQVSYLKRHFDCVTLEEALAMIEGVVPVRPSLLLTFDDGYIDNYQLAYPILSSHSMQATFFVPTGFVGTFRLPWWDVIAFIVKRSRSRVIRLRRPEPAEVRIGERPDRATLAILGLCVRNHVTNYELLIEELEQACDCTRPGKSAERCFLNWDEVREMQRGGMAFGSHTHNHEILTGLSSQQQFFELYESRKILEHELGRRVDAVSYPVGLQYTFSGMTKAMVKGIGYRAGFSFYGGNNREDDLDRYDVQRCNSHCATNEIFRLQMTLAKWAQAAPRPVEKIPGTPGVPIRFPVPLEAARPVDESLVVPDVQESVESAEKDSSVKAGASVG
jgi:peptidoglycan/xylan/chitin deacetylase (PgdA/CDA1 family)